MHRPWSCLNVWGVTPGPAANGGACKCRYDALAVNTVVVLPLLTLRTTFWPFLSALRDFSVSLSLPLLLALLVAAVPLLCRRTLAVNFVLFELEATVQAIAFLLLASLHVAL